MNRHAAGVAATGIRAPTAIACEVVKGAERFRELEQPWQRLWSSSKAGIFQSFHWIEAWRSATSMACELHVAVAWQEEVAVAILPFAVRRVHGARILEWAAQAVTDYCCALSECPKVLRQLWDAVIGRGGFDIVRLKNVPPGSETALLLGQVIGHPLESDPCLSLSCEWANGDDWFRNLNKKKRSNWSRGNRMLATSGEVAFRQLVTRPDPELLQRLVEMKRQSLTANGLQPSCDATTLAALLGALEKVSALRTFLVTCDGNVVAASLNAMQGTTLLAYFAVYDVAYARASPGILLMTEYTKWAFDAGLTVVDYLRGEEPYKFEFANQMVRLNTYIRAETLVGRTSLALHSLWEAGRRLANARPVPLPPEIGSAYTTKAGTRRATPGHSEAAPSTLTIS